MCYKNYQIVLNKRELTIKDINSEYKDSYDIDGNVLDI